MSSEPFAFGFKAKAKPELREDETWRTWIGSGRLPADNARFLEGVSPILDKAVNMYVGRPDPAARARAKALALAAAAGYDPKQSKLQTHLLNQLQPLRRYAAGRRYVMKVPERQQYRLQALRDAEAELADELDRPPTDAELSDRTGLSRTQLARLRSYKAQTAEGRFMDLDQPGVVDNTPDLWSDFVYAGLGVADKVVFEGRFGLNGREVKTVQQLAKELGMSAATVSRRAAMIEERLVNRPGRT
jgi:AraC-like DNA-binding protein